MDFINLLSCCSFSSSYGPNRFISKNNMIPVCYFILYSIKLSLNDFDYMTLLSFSKSFTKTKNYFHSKFKAIFNFFSYDSICLSEMSSSFRMSYNDPFDINIK